MAKGWTIGGIGDQTREAATAAADEAGMPVGAWVERALRQALEPAGPEGVEIDELEALVRRVVAEELRLVKEALAHLGTAAASSRSVDGSPVGLMLDRRRQRRGR